MQKPIVQILSEQLTVNVIYDRLRHLPFPVCLDSNNTDGESTETYARFDILTADPAVMLITHDDETSITSDKRRYKSPESPFKLLADELKHVHPVDADASLSLPFYGGAIGFFGYDLARRLERIPNIAKKDIDIPDMQTGIYLWAVIRDNHERRNYLVFHPQCSVEKRESLIRLFQEESISLPCSGFELTTDFSSNLDKAAYAERFHKIIDYIKAGDCYQVNLAQKFDACYEGDTWQAFMRIKGASDAPFSAYMEGDNYSILSFSPERFIRIENGKVESKPIKGTRPRSKDARIDQQYAQLLRGSIKDQAENLMIVDLLRNDLSKNCEIGSVRVPKIFEIEAYSNVYHLVSTIWGTLARGKTPIDLLTGCFPGGSITGAPKLRAMEIIEELEPDRRSVYCGSIGYIDCNGNTDTNIAIRTMVCHNGRIHCWGGGGIVADSNLDMEYAESNVKVSYLMNCLSNTL